MKIHFIQDQQMFLKQQQDMMFKVIKHLQHPAQHPYGHHPATGHQMQPHHHYHINNLSPQLSPQQLICTQTDEQHSSTQLQPQHHLNHHQHHHQPQQHLNPQFVSRASSSFMDSDAQLQQVASQFQSNPYVSPSLPSSTQSSIKGKAKGVTKTKRVRTIFTPEQLKRLEQEFSHQMYLVGLDRGMLSSSLNLTEAQVKVWFQNRRIKFRKLKQVPSSTTNTTSSQSSSLSSPTDS